MRSILLPSLAAATILAGGCIADRATADELKTELEPARLVRVSGPTAQYLLNSFNPAVPVLFSTSRENLIAVVLDEEPASVFEQDAPPQCVDEDGVTCCDQATGILYSQAAYQEQTGWVKTGELCDAPRAAEGVEFVPIAEDAFRGLAAQVGLDSCFSLLAEADGTPRVLVSASSPNGWAWSYCFNELAGLEDDPRSLAEITPEASGFQLIASSARRVPLRAPANLTLARHHGSPPLPKVILENPPFCNASGFDYRRCHKDTYHLFYKDSASSYTRWVSVQKCNCQ